MAAAPQHEVAAKLGEPPVPEPGRTDPEAVAMRDAYVKWVVDKARPAGVQRPKFPDPQRTDQAARIQGAKYALWAVADDVLASKESLKLMGQQLGGAKPAPKGNYGKMADGLPKLSGDNGEKK